MTDPTPTDADDPTLPTDDELPADREPPADRDLPTDREPLADDPADEPPTDRPGGLTAAVVEYGDGPDECTIYPADASADALVTEWLTAEEGSFVALDEMR